MDNVTRISDEVLLLGSEHQAAAAMYYIVQYIQKGEGAPVIELQGRGHPHVHHHHNSCPKVLKSSEVRVG